MHQLRRITLRISDEIQRLAFACGSRRASASRFFW